MEHDSKLPLLQLTLQLLVLIFNFPHNLAVAQRGCDEYLKHLVRSFPQEPTGIPSVSPGIPIVSPGIPRVPRISPGTPSVSVSVIVITKPTFWHLDQESLFFLFNQIGPHEI